MNPEPEKTSVLDIPLKRWFPLNLETALVLLVLVAAIVSRFYDLGARTVSHDEVNHVVPTFSLYSGHGYMYDPMSHGPLQFHMMALSYALFGDNDFTSRIPAAVLSVAMIGVAVFLFRRYLGRAGALAAGVLLVISPFMLFYGRYARNEAYIGLWAILTLYAVLRYLERGEAWALFLFTAANAIHFTEKATSYMYAGGIFIFLFFYFVDRVARHEWSGRNYRTAFLSALAAGLALLAAAVGIYLKMKAVAAAEAAAANLAEPEPLATSVLLLIGFLAAGGLAGLVYSGVNAVKGLGWAAIRSERSFSLLFLLGTLVLPLATAVPIQWVVNPLLEKLGKPTIQLLYFSTNSALWVGGVAGFLLLVGGFLGFKWFGKQWFYHAAIFYIPTILLYTTIMTYPQGMQGGLVGALTYWMEQHGEGRGSQPLYYYALVTIPVYEFLPAIGLFVAAIVATVKKLWVHEGGEPFRPARTLEGDVQPVPTLALFGFWSIFMLAIFSYAGEKMPWLTTEIILPFILATGWLIGWLVESVPWGRLAAWGGRNYVRAAGLVVLGLLGIVTGRAAFRAAYINYDYALEYLVYAHATPYPKDLYEDIEELSYRIPNMLVAYDNYVRYPFWWYMRRYDNKIDFDANPTREARNALVIAVGDPNYDKMIPVVRENYYQSDYMRMWWPSWDYWSLKWKTIEGERTAQLTQERNALILQSNGAITWEDLGEIPKMNIFEYIQYAWPHIKPFFTDPKVFSAVWQIWYNRDFTEWAALQGSDGYTLTNWYISEEMRVYLRKDLTAQLWPYGADAVALAEPVDPYESITLPASSDLIMGAPGTDPGLFASPRGIAAAPDGSLYIADSLHHRIQHIALDGEVLQVWGSFASVDSGNAPAPGGTFNEPWGVAVGPDGSVYVADTWNFRVQKFTADGQFVTMWSTYESGGAQSGFYGPRGLAVDAQGRVYVADTGNKRIVIFSADGEYITQFGTPGLSLGQLDEPVAMAVDAFGNVYVTDTWNQRVQVFAPDAAGMYYTAIAEWLVDGWYGNSLDNKPFITVDSQGYVSVTDPEQCRVLTFSPVGDPVRVWDGCVEGAFSLPAGIVVDGEGGLWVTDAASGTIVHLTQQY